VNAPASVTVLLDGQPHAVPAGCTLAMLVAMLGHPPAAVTTAVNECFVPRGQREQHLLRDGDAVLLFQPIVGG
jgi:sulfur carrier protein